MRKFRQWIKDVYEDYRVDVEVAANAVAIVAIPALITGLVTRKVVRQGFEIKSAQIHQNTGLIEIHYKNGHEDVLGTTENIDVIVEIMKRIVAAK